MAKKDKKTAHSTIELIELRQKLYKSSIWGGIGCGLVVVVLYIIWIVLAILGKGYGDKILPAFEALKNFPYFDTSKTLSFDFKIEGMLGRWLILIGVILLAIFAAIVFSRFFLKKNEKKSNEIESRSLRAMVKEEIGLDSIKIDSTDTSNDQELYKQIALKNVNKKYFITIASDVMSYDIQQIEYVEDGKRKNGVIFVTQLSQPKSIGYVQFRSYGITPYKVHNGKKISTYGLSSNPKNVPFIACTDLKNQEFANLLEENMVNELTKIHALTKSGILITSNNNTLSIFLAETKFNFLRHLKDKLDDRLLETQCEAINTVYQSLLEITRSFSILPKETPMVVDRIGENDKTKVEDVEHDSVK